MRTHTVKNTHTTRTEKDASKRKEKKRQKSSLVPNRTSEVCSVCWWSQKTFLILASLSVVCVCIKWPRSDIINMFSLTQEPPSYPPSSSSRSCLSFAFPLALDSHTHTHTKTVTHTPQKCNWYSYASLLEKRIVILHLLLHIACGWGPTSSSPFLHPTTTPTPPPPPDSHLPMHIHTYTQHTPPESEGLATGDSSSSKEEEAARGTQARLAI